MGKLANIGKLFGLGGKEAAEAVAKQGGDEVAQAAAKNLGDEVAQAGAKNFGDEVAQAGFKATIKSGDQTLAAIVGNDGAEARKAMDGLLPGVNPNATTIDFGTAAKADVPAPGAIRAEVPNSQRATQTVGGDGRKTPFQEAQERAAPTGNGQVLGDEEFNRMAAAKDTSRTTQEQKSQPQQTNPKTPEERILEAKAKLAEAKAAREELALQKEIEAASAPAPTAAADKTTPFLDAFKSKHPSGRFDESAHNETGKGWFEFINHKNVGRNFTELLTNPTRKIAELVEDTGSGIRTITDPAELKAIFASKTTDFGRYNLDFLPGNGSLGASDLATDMLNAASTLPGAMINFRHAGGNKIIEAAAKEAPGAAKTDLQGTCDDFIKQFIRRDVNKALAAGDTASAERSLELLNSTTQTMNSDAWRGATGFIAAFNGSNVNSLSFNPTLRCQYRF